MSNWQPIETAPKDGTWIVAKVCDDISGREAHYAGRCFVVKHMGFSANLNLDMGWALFPGMGVGDDFLSEWAHLPGWLVEASDAIPAVSDDEMVEKVGAAALEHMFDRRDIKWVLGRISAEDPEVWAEIVAATGRAALAAMRNT